KHHDHTQGLPSVLSLLRRLWSGPPSSFSVPRIHKFPHYPEEDQNFTSLIDNLSGETLPPPNKDAVFHQLQHKQILKGVESTLLVLHTPGHTTDSICLHLPEEKALFTADSVLGQGTSVFEDFGSYMTSLKSLLELGSQPETTFATVYPGHGPVVEDGPKLINEYIRHRIERETQILDILASPGPTGTGWTVMELVGNIYAKYPQNLWAPASRGVFLHLKKLRDEGRIKQADGEGEDARWIMGSRL
ncbi:hypothetical protein M422DRAFT_30663, partial [Sphaerobolus stellatus SS14]